MNENRFLNLVLVRVYTISSIKFESKNTSFNFDRLFTAHFPSCLLFLVDKALNQTSFKL